MGFLQNPQAAVELGGTSPKIHTGGCVSVWTPQNGGFSLWFSFETPQERASKNQTPPSDFLGVGGLGDPGHEVSLEIPKGSTNWAFAAPGPTVGFHVANFVRNSHQSPPKRSDLTRPLGFPFGVPIFTPKNDLFSKGPFGS